MAHGKPRDPRKEQHRRRWAQLWKLSGLTVRDFSARHQLAQPSFYAWRREPRRRDAATTFVPVRVVPDNQPTLANHLEVALAGGRYVRVTPGFVPATLRQELAVLGGAPPC